MPTDHQIFPDADILAAQAADLIVRAAGEAVAARGRFILALAGGTTPEKTYKLLAQSPRREAIDWARTCLFFGDERFVPPDDERSNYGMARHALLDSLPEPGPQVFPIPSDPPTPADAAEAYAQTLADFFSLPADLTPPAFDFLLLGMGDDGHTASLFPGMPSLLVSDRWAVASPPGTLPPPVARITLTFPVLNAARQVLFLVAGEKKAIAVRDILEGAATVNDRPAAGVQPADGTLTWLLDEAAAGLLTGK